MDSIKDNVLKAIESGQVKMRPRWQFMLNAALLLLGTIIILCSAVYLISFIFFTEDGFHGMQTIYSLPWLIVAAAIIFIVILEILVRKYSFAHRKPLLYITIGIVVFVLLAGFLVYLTRFHDRLADRAYNDDLPFGGGIYRRYDPRPHPDDDAPPFAPRHK